MDWNIDVSLCFKIIFLVLRHKLHPTPSLLKKNKTTYVSVIPITALDFGVGNFRFQSHSGLVTSLFPTLPSHTRYIIDGKIWLKVVYCPPQSESDKINYIQFTALSGMRLWSRLPSSFSPHVLFRRECIFFRGEGGYGALSLRQRTGYCLRPEKKPRKMETKTAPSSRVLDKQPAVKSKSTVAEHKQAHLLHTLNTACPWTL